MSGTTTLPPVRHSTALRSCMVSRKEPTSYADVLREFDLELEKMTSGAVSGSHISTIKAPSLAPSTITNSTSISVPMEGTLSWYKQSDQRLPVTRPEAAAYNEYVLMFNRSTGNPRVHYLMIDPHRKGRLLPKVNFVTMTKVKDLSSFRAVVLDNFLYIIGGRNLESGVCVGLCYRFDPRNNQWIRIAPLLRARCRFTATAMDGFIYVVGEYLSLIDCI